MDLGPRWPGEFDEEVNLSGERLIIGWIYIQVRSAGLAGLSPLLQKGDLREFPVGTEPSGDTERAGQPGPVGLGTLTVATVMRKLGKAVEIYAKT
jgi:hypothetical protein